MMMLMLSWLGGGSVQASAADRNAALALEPLESLEIAKGVITIISGGAQTTGALPVRTKTLESAVYSSRGRRYAPYNEDGAVLLRDGSHRIYMAAFDQAGGLGGSVRGAASQIGAEHLSRCFQTVAQRGLSKDVWAQTMVEAMEAAHAQLRDRGEGEVTTGVSAIVTERGEVQIATSGDSAAIRFSSEGEFQEMTPLHEGLGPFGSGCLTHALGLLPEGPDVRSFEWSLDEGGWLLLCTDGLLDSGLKFEDIGKLLTRSSNAEKAVNELARQILRRMKLYRAKPDNLSLVAARRL